MPNITIKGDPTMGAAIAEGAAAVELRAVKAEYAKLQARDAVRSEADKKRWERTRRRLARKYSTRPVGRARGAILGLWGLLWLSIHEWFEYFRAWNRGTYERTATASHGISTRTAGAGWHQAE